MLGGEGEFGGDPRWGRGVKAGVRGCRMEWGKNRRITGQNGDLRRLGRMGQGVNQTRWWRRWGRRRWCWR